MYLEPKYRRRLRLLMWILWLLLGLAKLLFSSHWPHRCSSLSLGLWWMFCLLPFRSSGCLSWIDFSDARVVGIEPTTCGFGDRCSTNWATPVTPPYCVKTYAQVGFGLKLPFAHALAGFRWADDRDWTGDLVLTKDVLYQLSYISMKTLFYVGREGFEPPKT